MANDLKRFKRPWSNQPGFRAHVFVQLETNATDVSRDLCVLHLGGGKQRTVRMIFRRSLLSGIRPNPKLIEMIFRNSSGSWKHKFVAMGRLADTGHTCGH